MLSSPATGTTSISVTTGAPCACCCTDSTLFNTSSSELFGSDLSGLDHHLPARDFLGEEFRKLAAVARDHVEADRFELRLHVGRLRRSREFGFKLCLHRRRQTFRRSRGLPGIN